MCTSSEAAKRSHQIDIALRKSSAKETQKILLLGTGESGKSTVVKQMKILFCGGYNQEEKVAFRVLVFRNCLRSIKALVDAMDLLSITFEDESIEQDAYDLLDVPEASFASITPFLDLFKKLWKDSGVQKAYQRRNEFQLSVSTAYFLDKLDVLASDDYLPDHDDILHAREATTGIHEITFELEKVVFSMLDVGGQRSERRKWIHCFENITVVIFIAASSEYDEVLAEDSSTNRMKESVALFSQIIGYWWFRESSFVLFLNKQDLLEEKVKRSPIAPHFPEYQGTEGDFQQSREFIKSLYANETPDTHDLFVHFTTATNSENIKYVFEAVRTTLLKKEMQNMSVF